MLRGTTPKAVAISGTAVLRIVVSNASIKKAMATNQGSSLLIESLGVVIRYRNAPTPYYPWPDISGKGLQWNNRRMGAAGKFEDRPRLPGFPPWIEGELPGEGGLHRLAWVRWADTSRSRLVGSRPIARRGSAKPFLLSTQRRPGVPNNRQSFLLVIRARGLGGLRFLYFGQGRRNSRRNLRALLPEWDPAGAQARVLRSK
jgi:hypothetical protein